MKEMNLANLTIHNIDESIANNLRALAKQYGELIEEEVQQILLQAFSKKSHTTTGLGSKISERFIEFGRVKLPQPIRSLPRQSANFCEVRLRLILQ
jgi:plasmid stability protein